MHMSNKLLKTKLFIMGFIIIGSTIALDVKPVTAAPAITSISGTVSHGSTVTVTGSGFGTKSPVKPLIWANFEAGLIDPTNLGVMTTWTNNSYFSLTTSNQSLNSTYAVFGEYNTGLSKTGPTFRVDYDYYQKIYVFFKRYRDFAPPSPINMKFFRIWPVSDGTKNDFLAEYLTNSNPNKVGRCYTESTGESMETPGNSSYQGTVYTEDTWGTEEFQWSQNSALGVADGTWRFWRNGMLMQTRDNLIGRSTTQSGNIIRLYIDNYSGGSGNIYMPPDGSMVYVDDVYIDNTWARVIIGDQNTFDDSTHREIQIPSAWSDTSIAISINKGSFNTLNSAYLYVFDANGNVNASGYPLCPNCPKPPTSLQVQ